MGMTEIINLNKKRKEKRRAQDEARAVQNRLKHGRTKHEKQLDKMKTELRDRQLQGHKRETDDEA